MKKCSIYKDVQPLRTYIFYLWLAILISKLPVLLIDFRIFHYSTTLPEISKLSKKERVRNSDETMNRFCKVDFG